MRAEQQIGHADHAIHRRADLVAHVGQELRLDPVRVLRGELGCAQFALGQHLLGHVLADAAVAGKGAVFIEDRLAADAHVHGFAVDVGPAHHEIVERLVARELRLVFSPLFVGHFGKRQLPALFADVLRGVEAGGLAHLARHFHEAELTVLFPVPVRRQVGQAAKARLALAQLLFRQFARGDVLVDDQDLGDIACRVVEHPLGVVEPADRAIGAHDAKRTPWAGTRSKHSRPGAQPVLAIVRMDHLANGRIVARGRARAQQRLGVVGPFQPVFGHVPDERGRARNLQRHPKQFGLAAIARLAGLRVLVVAGGVRWGVRVAAVHRVQVQHTRARRSNRPRPRRR